MFIKKLELTNVKSFKHVEFSLPETDGSHAGWTVFVGGNSSGKSTLLKGIALALMGPEHARQLIGSGEGWLRRGEREASVSLMLQRNSEVDRFRGMGKPPKTELEAGIRWRLEGKGNNEALSFKALQRRNEKDTRITHSERGPWQQKSQGWFCAGYGPMRRLSGSSSEAIRDAMQGGPVSRFVTLFREDAALSESEEWLKKQHSRALENKGEPSLKRLLDGVQSLLSDGLLPRGMVISRITVDRVWVRDDAGLELPLRDVSDGCRSIYATVLDLVHSMHEVYGGEGLFTKNAENKTVIDRPGVVIIDELEAHLHPDWQRSIPEWFKTHFPKVQFLVSTHSPLIAQAADKDRIFVLPLPHEEDRAPRQLIGDEYERVRWGGATKILLGEAFGLKSTRSRWANRQIERWQTLNAKKQAASLTAAEGKEHSRLQKQMQLGLEPISETVAL